MREGFPHDYANKASFDHVYDLEDPRPYVEALGGSKLALHGPPLTILLATAPTRDARVTRRLRHASAFRSAHTATTVALRCNV